MMAFTKCRGGTTMMPAKRLGEMNVRRKTGLFADFIDFPVCRKQFVLDLFHPYPKNHLGNGMSEMGFKQSGQTGSAHLDMSNNDLGVNGGGKIREDKLHGFIDLWMTGVDG